MFENIYKMSDEEIEKLVDDYLKNTPKEQLFEEFEKAGLFREFKNHPEDINWEIFIDAPSKTFSTNDEKEPECDWTIKEPNFVPKPDWGKAA